MKEIWDQMVAYWEKDPILFALVACAIVMLILMIFGFCIVCSICCKTAAAARAAKQIQTHPSPYVSPKISLKNQVRKFHFYCSLI